MPAMVRGAEAETWRGQPRPIPRRHVRCCCWFALLTALRLLVLCTLAFLEKDNKSLAHLRAFLSYCLISAPYPHASATATATPRGNTIASDGLHRVRETGTQSSHEWRRRWRWRPCVGEKRKEQQKIA